MGPMSNAMINTDQALGAPLITLQILATPTGVLLRADGDLKAHNDAANVAGILCRFAEGLFVSGKNVQLDPDIVEAVL